MSTDVIPHLRLVTKSSTKTTDITARTITSKISMTITSPENYFFEKTHVGLESADGYISDSPPFVAISGESNRQKLNWQHRSAKAGDQLRTRWSLCPRSS